MRRNHQRIDNSGFSKSFAPQQAGIALTAGAPLLIGIVAAMREREIEPQLRAPATMAALFSCDERRVDA